MEQIGKLIKKQQAGTSLQRLSETRLVKGDTGEYELSAYRGQITEEVAIRNTAMVKAAFPTLPPEFFKLMIMRMKQKGFSDQRMTDAVNNVIDNCQYPTPTLAQFLSYDKRVKLLTYKQLTSLVTEQQAAYSDYSRVKINGQIFFVSKAEKALYDIPDEM